jgi:hypothetical protein
MATLIERANRNKLRHLPKQTPLILRIAVESAIAISNAVNPLKIKRYASK